MSEALTVWWLVFFNVSGGFQAIETPYPTRQECEAAGNMSKEGLWNHRLGFFCAPAPLPQPPETSK